MSRYSQDSGDRNGSRPATSVGVMVKPVTPRTWSKLPAEQSPVRFYGNDVYGSSETGRGGQQERDGIPAYQPLSARGTDTKEHPPQVPGSRPLSRLGVERSAAASKFIVPKLDLSALQQRQQLYQQPRQLSNAPAPLPSGYGEPTPAQKQQQENYKSTRPRSNYLSGSAHASAGAAPTKVPVRAPNFKIDLSRAQPSKGTLPAGVADQGIDLSGSTPSRPTTRLGRPLSSAPGSSPGAAPTSPTVWLNEGTSAPLLRPSTAALASPPSPDFRITGPGSSTLLERTSSRSLGNHPSVEAAAAWVTASKSFIMPPLGGQRGSFSSQVRRSESGSPKPAVSTPVHTKLSTMEAARKVLMTPGPINEPMKCRVSRAKSGLWGSHAQYALVLDDGECLMMTARRHRRANGATSFSLHINMPDASLEEESITNSCAAKLHASFMGTEYRMIVVAADESEVSETAGARELGAILYAPNIIGTKGPRKATVVLPKLIPSAESSWELQPASMSCGLIQQYRQGDDAGQCIVLKNRPPRWNEALRAYCLNFGGRVTHASVKNLQLVSSDDEDRIVLQFGKVGAEEFTLDYAFPISPLQAFMVALSSLDPKLGCE